jgi:GNAT superfamily N-acetyltransferase
MRWTQLSESMNPWFEHGEAQLFLAERDGRVVGRISAQVDFNHLERHEDGAGFFGWFESIDDETVSRALLERAEDWCRQQGMERIRGPFNFSINEECGLLVEGFDSPPYVMMPHGRPYYQDLVEQAGYEQEKDLYAWQFQREEMPQTAREIAEDMKDYPDLELRTLDMDNIERDVDIIMDIFNDAWSDNWGYVPMTEAEIQQIADEFKLIVNPDLCLIAEHEGEPVGMCVALPNINEAFEGQNGRLLPFGWAKALWDLKVQNPSTFRLILLGLREEARGTSLGGLSVLMYSTIHQNAYEAGYEQAEASWTLADNDDINRGMEFMGATQYKTYRIYERELSAAE